MSAKTLNGYNNSNIIINSN